MSLDDARGPSQRPAAIGALVFGLLFVLHHVLQGGGSAAPSPGPVVPRTVTPAS